MSDEEEDYMSDTFLAKLQDVTPSLIKNSSQKRQIEIETKQRELQDKNKFKPLHEIQKEKLKEGLDKALTADNKGFAMLSRMGFKPGTSLGSKSSESTAIKEPIKINVNMDGRSGLGARTAVMENRERQLNNLKRKMNASDMSAEDYRKQMREATDKKQATWDLRKLQNTCRILDLKHDIRVPIHLWFWPEDRKKNDDSSDDEDDEEEEAAESTPEISVSAWNLSFIQTLTAELVLGR